LPQATFRGIDILDSQVNLFNEEASKLLGPGHHDRMSAIQGDLNEPEKTPALSRPEWFGFDCLVISFALHHVDDPIDFLKRLKARVKPGGTVVVVDWLKEAEAGPAVVAAPTDGPGEAKYNPDNMLPVPMGKVWPGFSVEDIHEDYEAAGCTDVEIRIWPNPIELPRHANIGGRSTMYVSKATVPLTLA
jgi:SAM-dependent methyltransferase